MHKLLIVSYFFPPSNDIAARRFGTMAGYLEKLGVEVYVLTTHSEGTLPVNISEQHIIRTGTNRQTSAHVDDLKNEKLPSVVDKVRKPARGQGLYFRAVDRTIVTWYRMIKEQVANIDEVVGTPDLIVGSFGPAASLWAARFLSRHYHRPWIADIRDLGAVRVDDRTWLARRVDMLIEKRLFSSASAVLTVSPTLMKILQRTYKKPGTVIYNGWDQQLNVTMPEQVGEHPKYIYYAGRFYEDRIEAMKILLGSLVGFPGIELWIRSLGPNDLDLLIANHAAELRITERVYWLPPCNQETVNRESEQALANLVVVDLSNEVEWTRGSLTGKIFELMVHTAPILAIGRSDNDMGEVLEQTRKGKLCSNSNDIKEFLFNLEQGGTMFSGDKTAINNFSREQQATKFYEFAKDFIK